MENIIRGIVLIFVACAAIAFRKRFARETVAFQNKTFGLHFGEKETMANERLAILLGAALLILGGLSLFGIIWD